jgi:hypothetical protein
VNQFFQYSSIISRVGDFDSLLCFQVGFHRDRGLFIFVANANDGQIYRWTNVTSKKVGTDGKIFVLQTTI